MPATDSYLCLRLLTEITGQLFWLFLKRRCLMELFISKPPIRLSMLNEIKKNHSCWQEEFYASGSKKEIVISIIMSFISINLSHYYRNCFNKLFFHWVYYEIWISKSFQSTIPKDVCYTPLK